MLLLFVLSVSLHLIIRLIRLKGFVVFLEKPLLSGEPV